VLLDRLREVGVQPEPEPAREHRRLPHQLPRDRERRAGRHRDLDAGAGPCLVQLPGQALGFREYVVEVLDQLVGREASVRGPEVHRAAGRDDAHAELPCGLDLRLDQPVAPARKDVVVVEDRRAAGERELGDPGPRGGVLGLGVDSRPHWVELAEPAEEVRLLRTRARERLAKVVVRVHEPGSYDCARELHALVGLRLLAFAD
jgi:hypothetical protein